MISHSEDKDDRFSLTLTSWQRWRGWRGRRGIAGWKIEIAIKPRWEAQGQHMYSDPPLSKDGPSGGHRVNAEECRVVCVCVYICFMTCKLSMARCEHSLNNSFLSSQGRGKISKYNPFPSIHSILSCLFSKAPQTDQAGKHGDAQGSLLTSPWKVLSSVHFISYLLMLTCNRNVKHLAKKSIKRTKRVNLPSKLIFWWPMSNNLYWSINHIDHINNKKTERYHLNSSSFCPQIRWGLSLLPPLRFCAAQISTYFTIQYVTRCQYTCVS